MFKVGGSLFSIEKSLLGEADILQRMFKFAEGKSFGEAWHQRGSGSTRGWRVHQSNVGAWRLTV
jgi:hypothetical protein